MAYSPEKIQALENALRKTAELVGKLTETPNQDGVKTGLDLTNESLICNHAADAVKEGVFKVVVMGGSMGTGKTSVINALSGSRILPDTVFPTTPIISYLRYGADDKKIYVYKNNKSVEGMSYEAFFNKFKFSNEDAEEARKTGLVKRFSDVEYSVVYSNVPLLKNGVQLLDVPSWLGEIVDASKTIRLAKDANAIIYMGNAISGGFNINDREFLKSNFEGRHSNNVFFLINKSDCLTEEELEEIKSYYKVQLTNLFTDENGDFNEDLYAKRVFFVSARNVLKKKTGEESYDDRDIPAFERFEKELEEFLTTDARSIATLNACFALMANAYKASIHTANLNKAAREKDVETVKEELSIAESKLGQIENELEALKKCFQVAKTKTEGVIQRQLNSLVGKIDETWDKEMEDIMQSAGFGIPDLMAIAWQTIRCFEKEEKPSPAFEEIIRPFSQGVQNNIKRKTDDALSDIDVLIQPALDELIQNINFKESSMNELINEIYTTFDISDSETEVKKGKINPIQLINSTLNDDVNEKVDVLAGNKMGWKSFLIRSISEMFTYNVLGDAIGGIIGLTMFSLYDYWWWRFMRGKLFIVKPQRKLTKDQFIAQLQLKINGEGSDMIFAKISDIFDEAFCSISKGVKSKIADERKSLAYTQSKLDDNAYNYEAEIERCEYISSKIWEPAQKAYQIIFEKDITLEKFLQFNYE